MAYGYNALASRQMALQMANPSIASDMAYAPSEKSYLSGNQMNNELANPKASSESNGMAMASGLSDLANMINKKKNAPQSVPINDSMERRLQEIDNSPAVQIKKSIDYLRYLPEEQRMSVAYPLMKAEYLSKQGVG